MQARNGVLKSPAVSTTGIDSMSKSPKMPPKARGWPARKDNAKTAHDSAFGKAALGGSSTKARATSYMKDEGEVHHGYKGYSRSAHLDDYFKGRTGK